jgi:hypothetical protein
MSKARIGLREVRALAPGGTLWDTTVTGFGARRQKSAAVFYHLKYATQAGRQRWHVIGKHGSPWTPDEARTEALRLLGDVARGLDPAAAKRSKRFGDTVGDLCDRYLADAESGRLLTRSQRPKKADTIRTDRYRIALHVKPLLGKLAVAAVTRDDVDDFMHSVAAKGGTGGASRTDGLTICGRTTRVVASCASLMASATGDSASTNTGASESHSGRLKVRAFGRAWSVRFTSLRSPDGAQAKSCGYSGARSTSTGGRRCLQTPRPANRCARCLRSRVMFSPA